MIVLLAAMNISFMLENPASSLITLHPQLRWALKKILSAGGRASQSETFPRIKLSFQSPCYCPKWGWVLELRLAYRNIHNKGLLFLQKTGGPFQPTPGPKPNPVYREIIS